MEKKGGWGQKSRYLHLGQQNSNGEQHRKVHIDVAVSYAPSVGGSTHEEPVLIIFLKSLDQELNQLMSIWKLSIPRKCAFKMQSNDTQQPILWRSCVFSYFYCYSHLVLEKRKIRRMGTEAKSPAFGPAKLQWRTTQIKVHIDFAISSALSVEGSRHKGPVLIIFQKGPGKELS